MFGLPCSPGAGVLAPVRLRLPAYSLSMKPGSERVLRRLVFTGATGHR